MECTRSNVIVSVVRPIPNMMHFSPVIISVSITNCFEDKLADTVLILENYRHKIVMTENFCDLSDRTEFGVNQKHQCHHFPHGSHFLTSSLKGRTALFVTDLNKAVSKPTA